MKTRQTDQNAMDAYLPLSPPKLYASLRQGYLPFFLKELSAQTQQLVMVVANEREMRSLAEGIKFFHPAINVLTFPGWDCLPYDRSSPRTDIVAERVNTLSQLAKGSQSPLLVITPISAFLQKVPPKSYFKQSGVQITQGQSIDLPHLIQTLSDNAYMRVETVREPGEFCIRGGLIDIFPGHYEFPIRLDLFGDEVESLHQFDPLSQRRGESLSTFDLSPCREVHLGKKEIASFKNGYRNLFGSPPRRDDLYHGILEGKTSRGYEHWLPLFHQSMSTILEYLDSPLICLDHNYKNNCEARWTEIQDYYQARKNYTHAEGESIYNPLPPNHLYLNEQELDALLKGLPLCFHTPLLLPEGENIIDFGVKGLPFKLSKNDLGPLKEFVKKYRKTPVYIGASSLGSQDRIEKILKDQGFNLVLSYPSWEKALSLPRGAIGIIPFDLEESFISKDFALINEEDLLGEKLRKRARKKKRSDLFIAEASTINLGDYVVHDDHGIGQYQGLTTININKASHDCVSLSYEGGDKLFVPVENLDVLSRYGGDFASIKLDKLGQSAWQARKAKVKKNLLEMAEQLIKVAAARKYQSIDPILSTPGSYDEFCARFAFAETEDQLQAIDDVLQDLHSGDPMDRLVCGDVGFGKTEVALRAAFTVASAGKQVVVVTPTTLLCRQHAATFKDRFEGLGFFVESLSRLVSPSKAKKVKQGLQEGTVDIVIGTHALLSPNITFKNLGLVIVDEEQHFGVKQKEKLKALKNNVHVMSLTATPIPRTLQMAMNGVKDMSIIATPPIDRLAVRTFVMPYDGLVVKEALEREHNRGGQSFYVCPRIKDIKGLQEKLDQLVPSLKVSTAHGQMSASELEAVMEGFDRGESDILLATNIIESGIDVPNANTMIVHRADLFGLSQLYQLRGRIGRSKVRAYAYYTLSKLSTISKNAQRRLDVMQTLDSLGAGFQLASHDLDIRGAGNILGDQQSGHIKEIGIELYQQMLQDAISEIQAKRSKTPQKRTEHWSPQINIGLPILIPETYVSDLSVRLELYRRLSQTTAKEDIDPLVAELIDRFGPLPDEVKNLLAVVELKVLCHQAHVQKIDLGEKGYTISFYQDTFPNPSALLTFIQRNPTWIKLKPNQSLVFLETFDSGEEKIKGVQNTLTTLVDLVKQT